MSWMLCVLVSGMRTLLPPSMGQLLLICTKIMATPNFSQSMGWPWIYRMSLKSGTPKQAIPKHLNLLLYRSLHVCTVGRVHSRSLSAQDMAT